MKPKEVRRIKIKKLKRVKDAKLFILHQKIRTIYFRVFHYDRIEFLKI
jgi:hypothetical protein